MAKFVPPQQFKGFRPSQKMTPKEVANFKRRARKLFSKAFKLNYLAGISTIRIKFPMFRGNLKPMFEGDSTPFTEWANLIDTCLEQIDKNEWAEQVKELKAKSEKELAELQKLTPGQQIELLVRRHRQIELYSRDTFGGISYRVIRRDVTGDGSLTLGKWGYNAANETQPWYFMFQTGQVRRFSSSLVIWNFILKQAGLEEQEQLQTA